MASSLASEITSNQRKSAGLLLLSRPREQFWDSPVHMRGFLLLPRSWSLYVSHSYTHTQESKRETGTCGYLNSLGECSQIYTCSVDLQARKIYTFPPCSSSNCHPAANYPLVPWSQGEELTCSNLPSSRASAFHSLSFDFPKTCRGISSLDRAQRSP